MHPWVHCVLQRRRSQLLPLRVLRLSARRVLQADTITEVSLGHVLHVSQSSTSHNYGVYSAPEGLSWLGVQHSNPRAWARRKTAYKAPPGRGTSDRFYEHAAPHNVCAVLWFLRAVGSRVDHPNVGSGICWNCFWSLQWGLLEIVFC
jgi:hypothetical protein